MTITVQNVGRVRHIAEANGSFAVEQSAGSFQESAVIEGSGTLVMDAPYESPKLLQQYLHGYPSKVPMPKRATFSFSTNLRAANGRAASTQVYSSTSYEDGYLYLVSMGSVTHSTGTTIASTSTTSVLNVTSAAGLSPGAGIACATGTGGALECREIKSISSNAVTLKSALSSIPANASVVYGSATFYLAALDGSSALSLQTIVEGLGTVDRWLLKGGQIASPPAFKLAPGTIPTIDWSFQYAQHGRADGSESTMNLSSALSDQAYADTGINAVMDSVATLTPHASTTGVTIDASEINITPNIAYEPHTTPGGTNNIKQWVPSRVEGPPVAVNFLLPYESVTWRTARTNETAYAFTYQVGSSVTNGAVMISVPHVTVDNFQREAVGGLAGQRVSLYARQDTQTTPNTTAQALSPLKIHLF